MTSEQIQARISANAQEQAAVLASSSYDKLGRLRDAARRQEQGRAPRERVGVGY